MIGGEVRTVSEWEVSPAHVSSLENLIQVTKDTAGKRLQLSDLQDDPVPGLCVILKDFHDDLTSFYNHSGIPVERILCVYAFKQYGTPRQVRLAKSKCGRSPVIYK